jgi:Lar family restriction alleviation protein
MTNNKPAEVTDALLPCPFCGGEPHWSPTYIDSDTAGTVVCRSCNCSVIVGGSKEQRFAHWNTRSTAARTIEPGEGDYHLDADEHKALKSALMSSVTVRKTIERPSTIEPGEVERVAAAMKPNLFKLYPGGQSAAHERARKDALAAITTLQLPQADRPGEAVAEVEVCIQSARDTLTLALERLAALATPPQPDQIKGANGQDVELQTIDGRIVEVDVEIAPIVAALNAVGLITRACCSGHGHRPANIMLADGREIIIARNHAEGRKIDALFPMDINGARVGP